MDRPVVQDIQQRRYFVQLELNRLPPSSSHYHPYSHLVPKAPKSCHPCNAPFSVQSVGDSNTFQAQRQRLLVWCWDPVLFSAPIFFSKAHGVTKHLLLSVHLTVSQTPYNAHRLWFMERRMHRDALRREHLRNPTAEHPADPFIPACMIRMVLEAGRAAQALCSSPRH